MTKPTKKDEKRHASAYHRVDADADKKHLVRLSSVFEPKIIKSSSGSGFGYWAMAFLAIDAMNHVNNGPVFE